MKSQGVVRIGAGAGTSDDRMVPALELAERGNIDYLVFECLAERTVSRENLSRSKNPDQGYSPSLHARLRMVLPACMRTPRNPGTLCKVSVSGPNRGEYSSVIR